MKSLIVIFFLGLLSVQASAATMVTDVRTGESDGKVRFVVTTEEDRRWTSSFRGNELVLVTQDTQTSLKSMTALRARDLGQISFKQEGRVFGVHVELSKPMRIVSTQHIPAKAGQQSRWVIDMVVDQDKAALVSASVSKQVAKVESKQPVKTVLTETKPISTPVVANLTNNKMPSKTATVAVAAIKEVIQEKTESQTLTSAQTVASQPQKAEPVAPQMMKRISQVSNKKVLPVTPIESLSQATEDNDLPIEAVVRQVRANIEPFKGTKPLVVAIDAGHGGKDVGAISISGKLEKDLTLAMAKELKRQIDAQPGMRAVLTRDKDYFISLRDRPKLARAMGADVFISLHADSYKDPNISGASFYVASENGASSHLAKFVASHSNNADSATEAGLDPWSEQLASNIGRMSMNASMEDSHNLASFMQDSMRKSKIRLQHTRVQSANFMVLKNIDMPSVLIETGFISNPKQDRLMQDPRYVSKLAASIVDGLYDFAKTQPEPGIVYANLKVHKGDTIAAIAQRHGISNAYLAKANNLDERATLKEGQKIRVPVNVTRRTAMLVDSRG